ncbi:unnamed protein product [Protopolystoma xenopodis]|uniref:Uncharacterized protein n=1 Tax=Protopolystoma xenopodis TaxID=117903 RepID=A0A448WB20_9PLAT|nr:unnamed protein product [Protopolystoma xenopodis]
MTPTSSEELDLPSDAVALNNKLNKRDILPLNEACSTFNRYPIKTPNSKSHPSQICKRDNKLVPLTYQLTNHLVGPFVVLRALESLTLGGDFLSDCERVKFSRKVFLGGVPIAKNEQEIDYHRTPLECILRETIGAVTLLWPSSSVSQTNTDKHASRSFDALSITKEEQSGKPKRGKCYCI